MVNKIPVYTQINEDVKERATMYVTKCKLMKKDIRTLSQLTEEAIDSYMINNPL